MNAHLAQHFRRHEADGRHHVPAPDWPLSALIMTTDVEKLAAILSKHDTKGARQIVASAILEFTAQARRHYRETRQMLRFGGVEDAYASSGDLCSACSSYASARGFDIPRAPASGSPEWLRLMSETYGLLARFQEGV